MVTGTINNSSLESTLKKKKAQEILKFHSKVVQNFSICYHGLFNIKSLYAINTMLGNILSVFITLFSNSEFHS